MPSHGNGNHIKFAEGIAGLKANVVALHERVGTVDEKLDRLDERIDKLTSSLSFFRGRIAAVSSVIGAGLTYVASTVTELWNRH